MCIRDRARIEIADPIDLTAVPGDADHLARKVDHIDDVQMCIRDSFYGIDMPDRDHLLAAHRSLSEMAGLLEVDSLGFLSVEGLYWALGEEARDPVHPQFTDHYFTGDYPTRLLDREIAQGRNEPVERQLSFLIDA